MCARTHYDEVKLASVTSCDGINQVSFARFLDNSHFNVKKYAGRVEFC
jgi:hypothetical protein